MKNVLFPLIAVFIWSINAIVNKAAASAIDPAVISFYRWFVAFVVMTPFVLSSVIRHRADVRKHGWKFAILGGLGMVMYQSLAYYAAHTVSATFMGIMISVIPIFTVILGLFILHIMPTLGIVIGSSLSLMGLSYLISQGHPSDLLHQGIGQGEFMMLIASAGYALYGVLAKKWAIPVNNWISLYMQIFFGVVMLLPNFLFSSDHTLNPHNISLVLFAGIAASIIAPYLWLQGVAHLGANTTASFMNLAPVFTAIIAITVLHEDLHQYHIIGGSVILLGVLFVQKGKIPLIKSSKSN